MNVDSNTVAMGNRFGVQVTVSGTRPPSQIQLANASGFHIQKSSTTSRMRIENGNVIGETTFSFYLSPKKPGKFVIGPAQVSVNGKTFQSGQAEINVTSAGEGIQAAESRLYYITAEVDKPSPYVREQVRYTMKFFYRTGVGNAQLTLPDFSRFVKEEMEQVKQSEQVVLQGVSWNVTEYNVALFPIDVGPITIPFATLAVDVARMGRITLNSNPVSLVVSRPPIEGKPKEYTGLVGQVHVTGTVSKRALKIGESTTLTLAVEGDADLRGFQLATPSWTDFKIYEDKPTFHIESNKNRVISRKTFKMALVPEKGGVINIPKIDLFYFDPTTKQYRSTKTAPISMNISGEAISSSQVVMLGGVPKRNVMLEGRDLMPIKRNLDSLHNDAISEAGKKGILATLSVSFLLYLFLFVLGRRRDRLLGNPALVRRGMAYRQFKATVKGLHKDEAFFEQAAVLLRTYLGDRFNLDGGALTVADIDPKLRPFGVSWEIIQKVEAFFQTCDEARYGGRQENRDDAIATLTSIVNQIEKGVSDPRVPDPRVPDPRVPDPRVHDSRVHDSRVSDSRVLEPKGLRPQGSQDSDGSGPTSTGTPESQNSSPPVTLEKIIFLLLLLPAVSFAEEMEEIPQVFLQANQAYEEGDYKKAQEQYARIQNSGISSGAIHFNLGNAYFRDNQLGPAIFHFSKASRLSPRDADIEYNLAFAREKVLDRIEKKDSLGTEFFAVTEVLTEKEAYFLMLFSCLVFLGLASLDLSLKRPWTGRIRNILFVVLALSITLVVSQELTRKEMGVVSVPEVSVYSGVGKNHLVLFRLHEGVEFAIIDRVEKEWAEILLADGKKGWVPIENILF